MMDELPNPEMNDHQKKNNSNKLETEKDSLNQKITELLDHLVRAQSTICALEKLNVSSELGKLTPNMLETIQASHQSPDGSSQVETPQNLLIPTRIFSEATSQDMSCSNVEKETIKVPTEPRLTAFSPWSPGADKSFPVMHPLYSSTESDCSLEETLPRYRLLSPRFPNLGESFSDDRKDKVDSYDGETREDRRMPGGIRANLSLLNLLPAHRLHSHCTRASSSESSGDDATLSWGQMLPQGPSFDYQSAQKILDTFLGFTSPTDKYSTSQNKSMSITDATQTVDKMLKADQNNQNRELVPRPNSKNVSSALQNKDALKLSARTSHAKSPPSPSPSPLHHTRDEPYHRSHMAESRMPPIPAKRSPLPKSAANRFFSPKTVEETNFSPVGVQESSAHPKSEYLRPLVSVSTPGNISEYQHNNAMTAYVCQSPTGSEPIIKGWDCQGSHQNSWPEGSTERKPRKEKTVHFHTLNSDEHNGKGQLTIKSKFMATRFEDQGLGDSTSLDSTLL
ncbi:flocculation protein FLO11-like [Xenopus tropicalis]|uniref:Flocculation protein FLO11-like n=1 Tax=Xenopus tropicalis TaxID=8364 RepID=A0A8J0T3D6_XENTR|nr:flocculation protein FLO11-like [Xenopus tropicalis]